MTQTMPKQLGLFVELPSNSGLTVDTIVARIRANHERMAAKVERKMAVEKQYYSSKQFPDCCTWCATIDPLELEDCRYSRYTPPVQP